MALVVLNKGNGYIVKLMRAICNQSISIIDTNKLKQSLAKMCTLDRMNLDYCNIYKEVI